MPRPHPSFGKISLTLDMYRLILLFMCIWLTGAAAAQSLPDVPAAFAALGTKPQVFHLERNNIQIPSGGHFQGIQRLADSTLIITGSSSSYSYYLTTDHVQLSSIQKIMDSPYKHAGGFQLNGHDMVVGVENNAAKDESQIVLISFDASAQLSTQRIIAHRKGSFKRSTAGAVGFIRVPSAQQMLIAVGDWDSRAIDFYGSRPGNDALVDSLTTYYVPDGQRWCSYQTMNLLRDQSGHTYMIGLGLDGLRNRADLFELYLDPHQTTTLKLISTRYFRCKGGAGFRYASGIDILDGHLSIYSMGMHINRAVNVFR